jgi:hypothetical protein
MLPPKGDPRRPLHLAVRSARVLGVMFLLLGLIGVVPVLFRFGPMGASAPVMLILVASLMYFGPATCYLVFASFLAAYRPWAVTATLVVALLNTLLMLLVTCGVVIASLAAPSFEWAMAAIVGVFVLFLIALGQMLYHLIRSYPAVKLPPFGREGAQGFAPVFPAVPVPAGNVSARPPQQPSGA